MDLTDQQWGAIKGCFPPDELKPPGEKGGRPWRSSRDVLNGVLWVLRTGAPWADMPARYPPHQTCHRRFQHWARAGVMPRILAGLRRDLCSRGGIEDVEGFIDGTYIPAKRGVIASGSAVPAMRPSTSSGQSAKGPRMVSLSNHHSLSLLQKDPDTTLLSPQKPVRGELVEPSTLLSWRSFLHG